MAIMNPTIKIAMEPVVKRIVEDGARYRKLMSHMNEDALEAMKRSAIESFTAQLVGVVKVKYYKALEMQERDRLAKLHNISLFMGQLNKIAERQTKVPDWGTW